MHINIKAYFRPLLFISVCIGLSACGTAIRTEQLKMPTVPSIITLENGYSYTYQRGGLSSTIIKYSVAAGEYKSEYEDSSGTYFRGPKECLIESDVTPDHSEELRSLIVVRECGVYVPSERAEYPKIYYYFGSGGMRKLNSEKAPLASDSTRIDTVTQNLATQVAPNAKPIPYGVGTALGTTLVGALIRAENGAIHFTLLPPKDNSLWAAIRF